MHPIHIFRAGTQTDSKGHRVDFGADLLAKIAANYSPAASEAPLVVGHPATNDPAYGWVERLEYDDGKADPKKAGLWAVPKQVAPEFESAVEAGRFKQRSASFWTPKHPSNPTPGEHYLRHVGFLGAAAPSIKGLEAIQFDANDADVIEFSFADGFMWSQVAGMFRGLREWMIESSGRDAADQALPSYSITDLESMSQKVIDEDSEPAVGFSDNTDPEGSVMKTAEELAAIQEANDAAAKKIADDQAALDAQKAEFAEQQTTVAAAAAKAQKDLADARRASFVARASTLAAQGMLVADHTERLADICSALNTETVISFTEGEGENAKTVKSTPVDMLFDLLSTQPRKGPSTQEFSASAAVPEGMSDEDLAMQIRDYVDLQAEKGRTITFTAAREAVLKAAAH